MFKRMKSVYAGPKKIIDGNSPEDASSKPYPENHMGDQPSASDADMSDEASCQLVYAGPPIKEVPPMLSEDDPSCQLVYAGPPIKEVPPMLSEDDPSCQLVYAGPPIRETPSMTPYDAPCQLVYAGPDWMKARNFSMQEAQRMMNAANNSVDHQSSNSESQISSGSADHQSSAPRTQTSAVSLSSNKKEATCPSCGREHITGKFCPECGAKIEVSE